MKRTSKRVWSGVVALLAATAIVPLLPAPAASAAGTQQGQAFVRTGGGGSPLYNGDSSTTFTLTLPPSGACGGDSANDGYRVQSYIVPVSVDPSTLTFNNSGPIPQGVGANLRQPLYDTTGTPYLNAQTANAASPPGPGPVVNIPNFNYAVFSPGDIPDGVYNVGIACTLGPASGTQMKEFWNTKKTFVADAGGGPAQVSWTGGGVTAGNGCSYVATSGAILGWYPGVPGSQSALKAACTFNNNGSGSQVSASYTFHDMRFAQYHNGAARRITVAAAAAGATTLTASPAISGTGMAAWVNRTVSGPGLAPRTFVKSISGNTLTLNVATSGAVAAGSAMIVENAPGARSVVDGVGNGTTTLTSATANFTAADADPDGTGPLTGLSVQGQGIPSNTFIDTVNSVTSVTMTNGATLAGGVLTIGATLGMHGSTTQNPVTSARQVTEATTTSTTVVSSAIAIWGATDVGLDITGVCDQNTAAAGDDYTIPGGVYITSVSGANATTTGGLTTGKSGCTIVVGDPNANAPTDGGVVAEQGMQFDLSPTLVPGSGDCGENQPEGLSMVGTWRNPGAFTGSGLANEQPGAASTGTSATRLSKAIGQIVFETSAATFSAFVIERELNTPMPSTGASGVTTSYPTGTDPIGARHYDIVVPFAPTALALCPGNASSPGLTFSLTVHGTVLGRSTLDTLVGRSGTGQVRSVQPSALGGYTGTVYARSDAPAAAANHWTPLASFQRLCIYPPGRPNPNNFQCGAG